MNSLLDDLDDDERDRTDREVTLSTATILGIFFGLVVLCGAFFGFGYKMGSHNAIPQVEAATAANPSQPASTFSDFKPAAGSPEGGSAALPASASASVSDAAESATNSSGTNSADTNSAGDASGDAEGPSNANTPVTRESARASSRAASMADGTAAVPEASATGDIFVQVAAVSHPEDANLLVNALRAKGYPVSAHTQPQDKFFHIQVGPFDSLKDAQATKQRLLADGYQPIIK